MNMPQQLRVMISSTVQDLPEHRNEAKEACLSQDVFPVMMEHLPASEAKAISASLQMVDSVDIYLLVLAHRYGYVPIPNNPTHISITELEYNRAADRKIPRLVFVMHRDHPIKVADLETGQAAHQLDAFKQRVQIENVVKFFRTPEDLRAHVVTSLAKCRTDLASDETRKTREITNRAKIEKQDTGLFNMPAVIGQVNRSSLLSRLHDLAGSIPVASVEGLPGSGKTFLVASYLRTNDGLSRYSSILWYDTHVDDTLTDFLACAETHIKLTSVATIHKCKELLHSLSQQNGLLVIDDFHQVDQVSYSTLINVASQYGNQTRLILISRNYVDLVRNSPSIGHLEVTGFSRPEMKLFLSGRGLNNLRSETIIDLIRKTDGLPLAATLFATLVAFGRNATELLSGTMVNTVRFRTWFDEVLSLIGREESKLLHCVSVCDGPFNKALVQKLCENEGISDADQAFENLQKSYLVQKYSPYRWNVHNLIAMFCLSHLNTQEKRAIHLILGHHYLAGLKIRQPRILDEEEFFWNIRACRQFQEAREFDESEKILHAISKTVNFRGHYELFIQRSSIELRENAKRDSWIDYHHAHFCLITGKLGQGLQVVEPLLYNESERDVNKRLAFARLYAEIMSSMGKPGLALQCLNGVMNSAGVSAAKPTVLAQARGTEVWLLTRQKKYSEAKIRCEVLLAESAQHDDKLGAAIALTHKGIIYRLSGSVRPAHDQLSSAAVLFRECEVKRGLAWSLSQLAITQFGLNDPDRAINSLREALRIYSDIGECSVEYLETLREVKGFFTTEKITKLINAEIVRITTVLSDSIRIS